MTMSGAYGPTDRREGIATIHAALDAGVDLLDTGDFYGMGHNELLIREALSSRDGEPPALSVKFGALRDPAGALMGVDARPAAAKTFLAYSLGRLGVERIEIYRPARLDPQVPIEETAGAIAELIAAGWVGQLGLSEVGPETIRRAHAVHPVCDVQLEYSLLSRSIEGEILATCRELGIGVSAYGVLSRGLLSGHWSPERALSAGDFRSRAPRFAGENLRRNLELVQALAAVSSELGASVAQVAVAWVLSRGEDIVPLVGARRPEQLEEALGALELELTPEQLERVEAAVPPGAAAGERYPEPQMAHLDSERSATAR
jgi:aryl-alcohol dehydrogenase-like predicted oxidoreductase